MPVRRKSGRAARSTRAGVRKSATRRRRATPAKRSRAAAKPRAAAAKRGAVAKAAAGIAPNGKPVPSGIGLTHHHMDYSSHDVEAMKRFFAETLGFSNVHFVPEHNYLTVFITPTSSLGFMNPMGVAPEQWQPPGEPNFYFFVEDVDRAYAELTAKGVAFDMPPTDMPWGHRMAALRDPEGRRVCLARNLPPR